MPRILLPTVLVCLLTVFAGCVSSAVDPRVEMQAPNDKYRGRLAKSINGSKLWRAYFDQVAPDKASARPLVAVTLEMEREVTQRDSGGDYDPGVVDIRFSVTDIQSRAVLYREERTKRLDDVIYGFFGEKATREEIQNIAFEAAEDDVFPYLDRWLTIAAIRAMGQRGRSGEAFVGVLEEQVRDPWAEDLSNEASLALRSIQGN